MEADASKSVRDILGRTPYDVVCVEAEPDCSPVERTALESVLLP